MNFLLNAIDAQTGGDDSFGDDGGWGSEDDINLSDDDGHAEAIPRQPQPQNMQGNLNPPPPPPPQFGSPTIRMGGGMIMGRLTQFLDTVAPQQIEDDGFSEGDGWANDDLDVDDAGGWADDGAQDALSNLDDDPVDESFYPPNEMSMHTNEAVVAPVATPALVRPGVNLPPPLPSPYHQNGLANSDLSDSILETSMASSEAVGMPSTYSMNQTFDTGNEAGWDDDDGLLFDDEDNNDVVNIGLEVNNSTQTPSLSPTANANDDGWDNDGLVFDDDNVDAVAVEAASGVEKLNKSSQPAPPPPPPPPPPRAPPIDPSKSLGDLSLPTTAAVASTSEIINGFDDGTNISVDEAGWDEDEGLLDDVGEDAESSKVVDSTPLPPPPPPVKAGVSSDGGGWGDDDDLDINISDDYEDNDTSIKENKNVVDHIPCPSQLRNSGDPPSNDATDGDDDISKDDTLSMANSRSQQNAVTGGHRYASNSTLGDEDSLNTTDVTSTDAEVKQTDTTTRLVSTFASGSGRLASRKVVDFTPRRTRFSTNDSLMVSGHTSVGESLDSIDEANEEDYEDKLDFDNAENLRKLSASIVADTGASQEDTAVTPRAMESGWGALKQQAQSNLTKVEDGTLDTPIGSALTPTAANSISTPNRFAPSKNEGSNVSQISNTPMVDLTPDESSSSFQPESSMHRSSLATSINVQGDSSEGYSGETDTVGVDGTKDELYGPMVDQIPATPQEDSPTRRRRTFSGLASVGSTVVAQFESKDILKDIREDDAMDEEEEGGDDGIDEASRGRGSMLEFDNRSLLSGLPLPVVDETQHLVDHVPYDNLIRRGGAASTMVMMDASMASSRADDNVDGTNNLNFGPIVDHTPSLAGPSRGVPSVATSVATVVSGLDGDIKEDDDMDNTTVADETVDSAGPRDDDEDLVKVEDDHIVDHVPEGKPQPITADASVRVLFGKDDDMTQVDTIAEDVALEFGPIVDHTPIPSTRATSEGLSVEASFQAQRNTDNATATLGSITEVDDNSGWDHDEPDIDDLSETDLSDTDQVVSLTGATEEEKNLVDHIPRRSFTKPVDGSTIVLVDPVDAASEVDDADDDTAGNARVDKFGPVVDHTPAPQSAPASLATSMANQANVGAGSDNRLDADVDGSATWFGASTLGGISSAAGDDDSGTGWDEDDDLGDLASPVAPRPTQTPINDHLVDHVPPLTSPRNVDTNASTAVAIDPSVVSNQTQEDKIAGGLFGAVVDHTPSVDPILRQSTDNSTMVTGFATNTKRDEEMDETTWQGGVSAQGEGWDQDDPELEELANSGEDPSPHLVDHVPERPESRYGDPSLIVAADPSDMSSQVEDLNQDENHFGPVVDQTPLGRVLPPPAVGSTVVAIPSVMNSVSDEGDNDRSNLEDNRIPNEWEEQIPNPQSGIDTDNTRTQLVDAVPPPEEQPIVRDASSEVAILDDKSTLVPADEPKEDEFGPVVDHTPMGETINGIDSSNRGALDHNGDGDKKLAANLDSVAPNCSVESKEKQDGLDEDEFGPVVDQLPASCSKSSVAPSKGGSTVDALATVSEGEDDLNTRDGWDDDTLDLIDQVSPTNLSHRVNHSVTWDDNVFDGKESGDTREANTSKTNDFGNSTFFTATDTLSSETGVDETKFYDPEERIELDGWGNDSLNIADDDTPPSTPRSSAILKKAKIALVPKQNPFTKLEHENWQRGVNAYSTGFGPLTSQAVPTLLDLAGFLASNHTNTKKDDTSYSLLDVACGPGQVIESAISKAKLVSEGVCCKYTALDFSNNFLKLAEKNLKLSHPDTPVAFTEGDAQDMSSVFEDNTFDSVTSNFGILHLAAPDAFLAESHRVLKPGGRLAFSAWCAPPITEGFDLILGSVRDAGNPNVSLPDGPPFFRFSDPDEIRRSLEAAGFVDIKIMTVESMEWTGIDSSDKLYDVLLEGTARTRELLRGQTDDETNAIKLELKRRFNNHVLDEGTSKRRLLRMPAVVSSGKKPLTLTEISGDKDTKVGVKISEGDSLEAKYRKLLQEEMAKRLLLEKESEALRKMVDTLKEAKELLKTTAKQHVGREDELISAISKWKDANEKLSGKVSKVQGETEKLSEDSYKYKNENGRLSSENEKLSSLNEKLSEDFSKLRNDNDDLSLKNRNLSSHNSKLLEDLRKFESESKDLQHKNSVVSSELEALRKDIAQVNDQKSEILAREAAYCAEIENLKTSLEKQLQASTSDSKLREDVKAAQIELSSKVSELSQLNSKLILAEEKLRKSEAQNFKHTKDFARMSKEHAQKMSELQNQIHLHQKDLEELRIANEHSIADLEERLSSEAVSNQNLQLEKNNLVKANHDLQLQLQNAALESQQELSQKDSAIRAFDAQLKIAQDNNVSLTGKVKKYSQEVERLTSVSEEVKFITSERDALKMELADCRTNVNNLQNQLVELNSSLGLNSSTIESVVTAINSERATQLQDIETSRNEVSALTKKLNDIESEKNSIQAQFEKYRKSQEGTPKEFAVSALSAIKEEAKLKKMQGDLHKLRIELQNTSNELQKSESERIELIKNRAELEAKVAGLGDVSAHNNQLKEDLSQFQRMNASQEQRISMLENNISENTRILSSKDQEITRLQEQQRSSQSDASGIKDERQQLITKLDETNAHISELGSNHDSYAVEMNRKVEELNEQIDRLNEDLQGMTNNRDILLEEKESLEVETEEMLVQFGLLNEEMIGKENEMAKAEEDLCRLEEALQSQNIELNDVQNEAQSYREQLEVERRRHEEQLREKEEDIRAKDKELENNLQIAHSTKDQLRTSERRLSDLIRESEEMTNNVGNVDENTKKLIEVNTALRGKLREMTTEQSAAVEQIQAMESDKMGLNGKVDDLQNLVDELIASFEAKVAKLQSTIEETNVQKHDISNKSLLQESEIARLSQELETSKATAEECLVLRRDLTTIQNKLSEQERLLLQKDAAAQDLYNQLQNAGAAPVVSAEMEMLRDTVRDLEATIANDKKELQELGEICDQTKEGLKRTREQLQFSEETAQQLQTDLRSKESVEATNQMLESRLDQLEKELMTAKSEEIKLRDEASDLKKQTLEQQSSKTHNSEVSAELIDLRRQVESLKQENRLASSVAIAREESMEKELRALQDQLVQKDNQIAGIEETQQSIDELVAENEKLKLLASELSDSATKNLMEENIELKTQLVSLAQALASSENCQADAIEKIETERQDHAESLRRMTVNMKRFYATLSTTR